MRKNHPNPPTSIKHADPKNGMHILLAFAWLCRQRGYPYKIVGDYGYRSKYQGDYPTKNRMKFISSKGGVMHILTFSGQKIIKDEKIPTEELFHMVKMPGW